MAAVILTDGVEDWHESVTGYNQNATRNTQAVAVKNQIHDPDIAGLTNSFVVQLRCQVWIFRRPRFQRSYS